MLAPRLAIYLDLRRDSKVYIIESAGLLSSNSTETCCKVVAAKDIERLLLPLGLDQGARVTTPTTVS